MTVKRFAYIKNSSISQYQSIPIQEIGKGKAFHCQGVVDELNNLWNENEQLRYEIVQLKFENNVLQERNDRQAERLKFYRKTFGKWDDKMIKELNDEPKSNITENKRFRRGKGIFIDYPSEAIIDGKTNERYYDGVKPNYESSKEIVELLNDLYDENRQLKAKVDDKEVAVEVETCKVMEKVFNLIDKSLEKDKRDYEMSYEDYLNGRIEALEELKKELKE